jgi:hypothetical protein
MGESMNKVLKTGLLGVLLSFVPLWSAEPSVDPVTKPEASAKPPTKRNLAVLTFDGDETTTPQQRAMLSDRLQMELIKSGKYVVLERSKMSEILNEQGFQQSGACTNNECQVEMGQVLGVDKMVTGKVVNFGPVWSISASLIDVATGRIDISVAEDIRGELFDVLGKGCPSLADQLTAGEMSADEIKAREAARAAQGGSSSKSSGTKWIVAGSLFATAVGLGVFGFLQNQAIQEKIDAYNDLNANNSDADFDKARKEAEDAESDKGMLRTIGYAAGGAALAGGIVVSIWF